MHALMLSEMHAFNLLLLRFSFFVPCMPLLMIRLMHSVVFCFTDSNPVCGSDVSTSNIAVEGDTLSFWCEITYSGKWAPQMTWRDSAGAIIPSSDAGTPGSVVRHEISITVEEKDLPIEFSCLTDFNDDLDPAPIENEATNVPDYEYTHTFNEIRVHCKHYK